MSHQNMDWMEILTPRITIVFLSTNVFQVISNVEKLYLLRHVNISKREHVMVFSHILIFVFTFIFKFSVLLCVVIVLCYLVAVLNYHGSPEYKPVTSHLQCRKALPRTSRSPAELPLPTLSPNTSIHSSHSPSYADVIAKYNTINSASPANDVTTTRAAIP